MQERLRPLERRVLAMRDAGMGSDEIAVRIRRSPAHVERIITWTGLPRTGAGRPRKTWALQERVLALRSDGESHDLIADRFRKSPRFIRQVEGLAHYRKAMELLG